MAEVARHKAGPVPMLSGGFGHWGCRAGGAAAACHGRRRPIGVHLLPAQALATGNVTGSNCRHGLGRGPSAVKVDTNLGPQYPASPVGSDPPPSQQREKQIGAGQWEVGLRPTAAQPNKTTSVSCRIVCLVGRAVVLRPGSFCGVFGPVCVVLRLPEPVHLRAVGGASPQPGST